MQANHKNLVEQAGHYYLSLIYWIRIEDHSNSWVENETKGAHTIAPKGYGNQGRLVVIWLTRGVASSPLS
jgi:hypothetical protein